MKNKDVVGGKVKEITIFFALIVQFIRYTHKCYTALQVCLHDDCNIHVLLLNILFCYRDEVFNVVWLVVRVHSSK